MKPELPSSRSLAELRLLPPVLASFFLSLTVAIASCYSAAQFPSTPAPAPQFPAQKILPMQSPISFKVLDFGSTPLEEGYEPQPKVFVFQDQEAWTQFWQRTRRLDANLQKPPAPKVDFTHQTIIGLTSGSHSTGGYSLRMDSIELKKGEGGDRWLIHYSELAPSKNCLVTQAPSTPTVFISIPKSLLPVEFKGQRIPASC